MIGTSATTSATSAAGAQSSADTNEPYGHITVPIRTAVVVLLLVVCGILCPNVATAGGGPTNAGDVPRSGAVGAAIYLDGDVKQVTEYRRVELGTTVDEWGPSAIAATGRYAASDRGNSQGFLISGHSPSTLFGFGQGPSEFTLVDSINAIGSHIVAVGLSGGGMTAVRYNVDGSLVSHTQLELFASRVVPTRTGYVGACISTSYDGDSLLLFQPDGSLSGSFFSAELLADLAEILDANVATDLYISHSAGHVFVVHPLLNKVFCLTDAGSLEHSTVVVKDRNRVRAFDPSRPYIHYTDINANDAGYLAIAHSSVRSIRDSDGNEVGTAGRVDIIQPGLELLCSVLVPGRPVSVALGADELLVCTDTVRDAVLIFKPPW